MWVRGLTVRGMKRLCRVMIVFPPDLIMVLVIWVDTFVQLHIEPHLFKVSIFYHKETTSE